MPDDIRSILEGAMANAETTAVEDVAGGVSDSAADAGVLADTADEGTTAVSGDGSGDTQSGVAPAGEGRPRDSSGKFAKAEASKTEAPKAAKPAVTPKPVAAKPDVTGQPAPAVVTPAAPKQEYIDHKGRRIDIAAAPKSFGPLVRERWASLPKEMRADLAKREADVSGSIGPAMENRQFREQFQQAVAPYQAMIQAAGADPLQYTQTLYQTAYKLQAGTPSQKMQTWAELAQTFGVPVDASAVAQLVQANRIPLEALAAALDGRAPQTQHQAVDPETIARQAEERAYQRMMQTQQQRQLAQVRQEADAFGAEKEFFDDIREDMADLLDRGRAKNYEEAYNRALLMHKSDPESQVGEVLRQREAEKAAQATVASTQKAKAAAVSVRGQPTATQAGGQAKDVRSALEAAIALHSGR